MKSHPGLSKGQQTPQFINPHCLFHGVWLPQWLEERPEVSEKAKKLYAYQPTSRAARATLGLHLAISQRSSTFCAGM